MAQSYLRTIEFKVKDTALKTAVTKLGKSLGSIDKNVAQINKNFTGLSKALKGVATEFRQIAKSSEKLAKNSSKQKSPLDPQKLTQSAKGLVKIKKLLQDLKNTSSLLDTDGRKTSDFNEQAKAFAKFIKNIAEGTKTLANNEAVLKRQISALATAANNAEINGRVYVNSVQAQTRAEQKLRLAQLDRIRAQKELYAGGTGGAFQNNKALLAMKPDNNIASLSVYRAELEQALSLVDLSGEEYQKIEAAIDGINERLNASSKAKKEQLKVEQDLGKAEAKRLKNQETFLTIANRSVSRAKFDTQAAINVGKAFGKLPNLAKIGIGVKGLRDMDKWLRRISPMFLDVDKKLGKLTQRIPVIGKVLNENLSTNARWSAQFIEGITSVNLAWSGMMQTIQAAQAFVAFEKQAAIALNNVARHIKQVWGVAGAMMMGLISPGQVGKNALASLNDRPEVMAARRGPSSIERLEYQLAKKQAELKNTELKEGARIQTLSRQTLEIEAALTEETRERIRLKQIEQSIMKGGPVWTQYDSPAGPGVAGAGWGSNMDDRLGQIRLRIGEELTANSLENSQAVRELLLDERKINVQLKIRDRILKTIRQGVENVNLSVEEQRNLFGTSNAEALAAQREMATTQSPIATRRGRGTGPVSNEAWARLQRMKAFRKQKGERLREGLMLGAGFPVLFGGGMGSVAGGTLGAGLQAKMGPGSGFGAQILLSAIGQQVDAFVGKTAELGRALNELNPDIDALVDSMGLAGKEIGGQIKAFAEVAGAQEALKVAERQMSLIIGKDGVEALREFGSSTEQWGNDFEQAMLRIRASVAGFVNWVNKIPFIGGKDDTDKGLRGRTRMSMGGGKVGGVAEDPVLRNIQTAIKGIVSDRDTGEGSWWEQNNMSKTEAIENLMKIADKRQKVIEQGIEEDIIEKTINQRIEERLKNIDKEIEKMDLILEHGTQEGTIQAEISEIVAEVLKKEESITEEQRKQIENKVRDKSETTERFNLLQRENAIYDQIGVTIKDGLVEGINAAIDGTKTLGEVASNVFKKISNALLNYGIELALMGMTGGTSGFFGKAFGYSKRAAGGPVTGGTPYVVGEKGPELFVPGSSGNIVPNHEMGGANIVVNVDASGSEVEGNEGQAAELGRMLGAAIQAELIREKRPGGLLAGTR